MKIRGDRAEKLGVLRRNGFPCRGAGFMPFHEYVKALVSSKFIWSPPGHGWSNHRDFEAFLAGGVPVVEYHPSFVELYRNLPVVQVRDWAEVTPAFLEQKWDEIQAKRSTFNMNRVYWPYWLSRLTAHMQPWVNKGGGSGSGGLISAPPLYQNVSTPLLPPPIATPAAATAAAAAAAAVASAASTPQFKEDKSPLRLVAGEVNLVGPAHELELQRQRAINWQVYPAFSHHMPRTSSRASLSDQKQRYNSTPCFRGCAQIAPSSPHFSVKSDNSTGDVYGPGTFSMVLPWCCEWMQWIIGKINFRGRLKEIYLYDKCSRVGLNAKDQYHIDQDIKQKLSDEQCRLPTISDMKAQRGRNTAAEVNDIKVRIIDMNEPGRSSCMSTDECGPYLAHIVMRYEFLTDGVFFMQPDLRHTPTAAVQQIVDWTHANGIAPVSYYPLGVKQGAGGNPSVCLQKWDPVLFENSDVENARRSGSYRNGIFYVSRLIVRQRPLAFWKSLHKIVNTTEMCAPKFGPCILEEQRAYKTPPRPPDKVCSSGPYNCGKSCNALEHVWGQVLCQPCHNRRKDDDPRYPWTREAKKHALLLASGAAPDSAIAVPTTPNNEMAGHENAHAHSAHAHHSSRPPGGAGRPASAQPARKRIFLPKTNIS